MAATNSSPVRRHLLAKWAREELQALRDKELQSLLERLDEQNGRQRTWLLTRIKQAAPQALVVPS